MIMIKIVGILLISVAAIGFGMLYSYSLRLEYKRLLGFQKLISLIRTRIECFNQPLSEIYTDFSEESLDECGFTAELKRSGYVPALCKYKDHLTIRSEILAVLADFGSGLGKSFSEEQIRHCDRYISVIEEKVSELEKELPIKSKTARALSAAAAIMIAIILI